MIVYNVPTMASDSLRSSKTVSQIPLPDRVIRQNVNPASGERGRL